MPLPPSPPPQSHPLDHHHPRPDNHPRKNRPPPHARPALSPAVRRPRGRTRCPRARTRRNALASRARAVRIRCLAGIGHRLDARPVRAAAWLRCGGEGHVGALFAPPHHQPSANLSGSPISSPWKGSRETHVIQPPVRVPVRNHLHRRVRALFDAHARRHGAEAEFAEPDFLDRRLQGDGEGGAGGVAEREEDLHGGGGVAHG